MTMAEILLDLSTGHAADTHSLLDLLPHEEISEESGNLGLTDTVVYRFEDGSVAEVEYDRYWPYSFARIL